MFELPLFPLDTVLFPGMPLSLYIFEERYKQMVQYCLEAHQPFGVVLIRRGTEALGPAAEPYLIGCTAQIARVEPLSEGRMNLIAIGQERFRILSLRSERPYLVGVVELYPLAKEAPDVVDQAAGRLRPWVERYLRVLAEAGDVQLDERKFPVDPLELAYLAAYLLNVPPAEKQALLALAQASTLLTEMRAIYRRELPLLREMLTHERIEGEGPFSLN